MLNDFYHRYRNFLILPWLVWLSGLSTGLRIKGSLVLFPVRAHACVAGQVPSWGRVRGNHTLMFLSFLSPFPPLKINKILKKKKRKEKKKNLKERWSPGWCGSVDWVPACELKGRWFDSQPGRTPGSQARSPDEEKQPTYVSLSHRCFSPFLSPFLPLSLKINK